MKNKFIPTIILAIILVVGTIVAFLCAPLRNAYFWISYLFAVISVVGVWACAFLSSHNEEGSSFPALLPRIFISLFYLLAVFLIIFFLIPLGLFPALYFGIHLVALAAAVIVLLLTRSAAEHINVQDRTVNRQVERHRLLIDDMEEICKQIHRLPTESTAVLAPAADRALELLRYSDPTQNPRLIDLDRAIEGSISPLSSAVTRMADTSASEADVVPLVDELCRCIEERNRKLKLLK